MDPDASKERIYDTLQPSPLTSSSVSIFDIPLILDLISDHLSKKEDYNACRAVCKTWFQIFNPYYYWGQFNWVDTIKENTIDAIAKERSLGGSLEFNSLDFTIRKNTLASIAENSNWVRHLTLGLRHEGFVGMRGLTKLLSLNIRLYVRWDKYDDDDYDYEGWGGRSFHNRWYEEEFYSTNTSRYAISCKEYDISGENEIEEDEVYWAISTIPLIKQNPGLKHLSIDISIWVYRLIFGTSSLHDIGRPSRDGDDSVLFALKNHPSLKSLDFKCFFNDRPKYLAIVLRNSPPTILQSFELRSPTECVYGCYDYFEPLSVGLEFDPDPTSDDSWPMFSVMKSVEINCPITRTVTTVLIQFLKRCPNLIKIQLPPASQYQSADIFDTIIKYCPKLKEIWIPKEASNNEEISHLLGSISCLQVVHLESFNHADLAITAILQRSSSSIETINLDGVTEISSKNIARVLVECPNLKSFTIERYRAVNCSITLSDLVHSPWASSRIEVLGFKIDQLDWNQSEDISRLTRQEIVDLLVELQSKVAQLNNPSLYLTWSIDFAIPTKEILSLSHGKLTEAQLHRLGLKHTR
ncbi:hypothetical protein BGZ76_010645 [Entomortierella beljakovae]|nr:hypothetical protein BGZ76_010645 [Entomortierella beljakovae]